MNMHNGLILALIAASTAAASSPKCKCTPFDQCWPTASQWNTLNSSVHGQLIQNTPTAQPCYPGPSYDAELCQNISSSWTDPGFVEDEPTSYFYPLVETCPPINATTAAYPSCDLGNAPVYTINATEADHVAAGIKFAEENNIRLVIKSTGHDIRGRSQGYGSLMIWLQHFRHGLEYQDKYSPSNGNCSSGWSGSAVTINGSYVWGEVYSFAADHSSIVVGGDDSTVGTIGGYMQGGGHGPASHFYGLAVDQVLEWTVVLASGEVVIANACQYVDLYTALRGGGGGTYGVVISATVKVYPTNPILVHSLDIVPLNGTFADLSNATAGMLAKYPLLSDYGFAGNAGLVRWSTQSAYTHDFIAMLPQNASTAELQDAAEKFEDFMNKTIVDSLLPLNKTTLAVLSTFETYSSFGQYITGDGSNRNGGEVSLVMASRFFDKHSLIDQEQNLSGLLQTLFTPANPAAAASPAILELCLTAGGKVMDSVPHSSVNPAWRQTYVLLEIIDTWIQGASALDVWQIKEQATATKLKAMEDAAPNTGTYMNEADPYDPAWKENFYGDQYPFLDSVKQKYDPHNVFWCYRCVGSEGWNEVVGGAMYGPLCRVD